MKGVIFSKPGYHDADGPYYTNKELADRMYKNIFYNEDIDKELDKLDNFDYIIANINENLSNIKPLSRFGVPVLMTTGDLPKRFMDNLFKNLVSYHGVSGIIVENICMIPAFKNYLNKGDELDYLYYPWGIDESVIKDYGEPKIYDFAQLGQFNVYQFRREIYSLLKSNNFGINYIRFFPNRDKITSKTERPYDTYCRTINQSKMSLGGCLQHPDYTYFRNTFMGNNFPKNIEIPGLNTLLFNTAWGDMESLGFKDGENFIQINSPRDCIRKILKYKEDLNELERITKSGYKLVHENHTNKIHADNLIKEIERIYK